MSDSKLWPLIQKLLHEGAMPLPDKETERRQEKLYLGYLEEHGLTEKEVLPETDWGRLGPDKTRTLLEIAGRGLADGLKQNNAELLRVVAVLFSGIVDKPNANRLARTLMFRLRSDMYELGFQTPDVVVGIYPVSSFNGHCVIHESSPLVLLNNGALSVLECCGMILAAEKLRPPTEQVQLLLRLATQYCESDASLDPTEVDHPHIWERIWTPMLITAAEEFVLAHELGHVSLGHLNDAAAFSLPCAGTDSTCVLSHQKKEELMADGWAIMRLVDRCRVQGVKNALSLDMAAAGPLIFLGTALLVEECYRKKGTKMTDYHPPASLRLYAAECLLEVLGLEERMNVGRHFLEHVKACLKMIDSDGYPPLLSRDLNRIVCPIVEALGVDNERMEMLREFR